MGDFLIEQLRQRRKECLKRRARLCTAADYLFAALMVACVALSAWTIGHDWLNVLR